MEGSQLGLVDDDFEEGAHEILDEELRPFSQLLTSESLDRHGPLILAMIALQSQDHILSKYLNISECQNIIKKRPNLRDGILAGSKEGYRSIRLASKELIGSSGYWSNIFIIELLRSGKHRSETIQLPY